MARQKRDRQDELNVEPQLQEVESAPDPLLEQIERSLPVEFMMEQVLMELESLPAAAQLSLLRLHVPDLVAQLDPESRDALARELGLSGESLQ